MKKKYDFNNIPDVLQWYDLENDTPRALFQIAELLEIAYGLTDHPYFREVGGGMDFFEIKFATLDQYAQFNMTVVERTITMARYYENLNSFDKILTISSRATEISIDELLSVWTSANEEMAAIEGGIEFDREQFYYRNGYAGRLTAVMKYLINLCNTMITLKLQHFIRETVDKKNTDEAKVSFLVERKAEFQHSRDQFDKKTYDAVMETCEIELTKFEALRHYKSPHPELEKIIEQFLKEKKSRISNHKLHGFLMEGKIDEFCQGLSDLALQLLSYHDTAGKKRVLQKVCQ